MLLSKRLTRSTAFKIVFTLAILPVAIFFATPSSAVATTNTYCISGNSTGAGWSIEVATWNPPAGGWVGSTGECAGVTEGAGCAALAQAFVDCINNTLIEGQGSAAIDPSDPCCFTITSGWNKIDLSVGPAGGDPDCEVTEAGCPFNPTIYLVSVVPTPIPTLTEWGMIIFCVLLFGWMAWVIVRRRRRVTASI